MQLIGQFKQAEDARIFSDYLLVKHIEHSILTQNDVYLVFVAASKQAQGRAAFMRYMQAPDAVEFRGSSWQLGDAEFAKQWQAPARSQVIGPALRHLWSQAGWVTRGLTILNIMIYLALCLGFKGAIYSVFGWFQLGSGWQQIMSGEVWRLVTPMLLHFNLEGYHLHIIFNLLWFWELALLLERKLGSLHFLLLVLVTAVSANVAQFFASVQLFGGMSGVVFGLLGYCWIRGRFQPSAGIVVNPTIVSVMLIFLCVGFTGLLDAVIGSMANAAHLFGLLSGMAYACYDSRLSLMSKK